MSENAEPTGDEQLPVIYRGVQMQPPSMWMQPPGPRYYAYSPYQASGNPYVLDAVPVPSPGSGERKFRRTASAVP